MKDKYLIWPVTYVNPLNKHYYLNNKRAKRETASIYLRLKKRRAIPEALIQAEIQTVQIRRQRQGCIYEKGAGNNCINRKKLFLSVPIS